MSQWPDPSGSTTGSVPPSYAVAQQVPSGRALVPGQGWVLLATTGQRFAARLIDSAITGVAGVLLGGSGVLMFVAVAHRGFAFAGVAIACLVVLLSVLFAFGVLYEVAFTATKGATPGKMIMRIRIVDEATLDKIGWGHAFLRWLLPWAAGLLFYGVLQLVTYMSFLWDGDHRMQGWHDKVAKDLVIQTG